MPDERPPLPPENARRLLTEEVVIEAAAPLPNPGATADGAGLAQAPVGAPARLVADPTTEYVGIRSSAYQYAEALPDYIDDVSRDFGSDIYERMALDAHIAGETNTYKLSVLANGVRLLPSHADDPKDAAKQREHRKAVEVMAFCQRVLDELSTPLLTVLDDMLSAFGQGNRCAEVVYRRDGSFLMPDRVKVKPRQSTAYVMDSKGNLVALLGAIAGQPQVVVKGSILSDPAYVPNILPRAKFAVLSWRPKEGDPRGTSAYRPAYNAWWQKRQTEIEFAKYICQFAGGAIFATVGEKAESVPLTNPDGTPVIGAGGKPVLVHPQTSLLNGLVTLKNGGVAVGPHGSTAELLVAEGAGEHFLGKLRWHNNEISKALLGQTLATNEGEHQARAASGNAKDVMDLLVQWGETSVAAVIRGDILRPAVRLNYGEAYLPYLPQVVMSAAEEADFAALAKAAADVGYTIDATQLTQMDAKLGLAPRSDEAVDRALAAGIAAPSDAGDAEDGEDDPDADDKDEDDEDGKKSRARFVAAVRGLLTAPFGSKKKAAP
jgi:hypothetical protein